MNPSSSRTPIVVLFVLGLFTALAMWSPPESGKSRPHRTTPHDRAASMPSAQDATGADSITGEAERTPGGDAHGAEGSVGEPAARARNWARVDVQGPPPEGFIDIPVRIVGRADETWVLETRRLPKDHPEAKDPEQVPVFSLNAKGELKEGVYFVNRAHAPQPLLRIYPTAVYRNPRGELEVKCQAVSGSHSVIMPGEDRQIDNRKSAPMRYEWRGSINLPESRRNNKLKGESQRNCNIVILNFLDEPLATIAADSVQRVQDRICSMLEIESEEVIVLLVSDNSVAVMETLTKIDVSLSYSNVVLALQVFEDFFTDHSEITLYQNLPNQMIARYLNSSQVIVNEILNQADIAQKWGLTVEESEHTILVNMGVAWHCDWQIPTPALAADFEAALTHEMLHALGFKSVVDNALNPVFIETAYILDFLRLRGTQGSVSGQTFFNSVRWFLPEISPGHRCVTKLSNAPWVFPMSTGTTPIGGDGYQAQHWKSDMIWGSRIGIMDPVIRFGEIYPAYLYASDVRAIDLIGWDIDESQFEQAPQPPEPIEPADDEVEVLLATTFTWTPTTSNSSLFVFEGTTPSADTVVFDARNLSGSSLTLPPGTLQGGTTYSWYVVAVGNVERTFGPTRTFTTRCVADFDGTGFVDTEDIDAFVQAYEAGDPSADVDGTGFVDTEDFDFFVRAYENGC